MASEFAGFISSGVGSGGGHKEKAGGWLQKAEIDELGMSIDEYIKVKTAEYFKSYDLISASSHNIDISGMKRYVKKLIPKGFAVSSEVFPEGTPVMVRTLEGDSNILSSPEIYLMVGIEGEVHPIEATKFHSVYRICNETTIDEFEYEPMVKNEVTGETKELKPLLKYCVSVGENPVYAEPLKRNTKVFTERNPEGYMYGKPGDYIAVVCEDVNDICIIAESIFDKTYEEFNP